VSLELSSSVDKTDKKSGRPKLVTLQGLPKGGGPTAMVQRLKPALPTIPPAAATAPAPAAPAATASSPAPAAPTAASLSEISVFSKSGLPLIPLLCADKTCSGHGQCVSGKCACTEGFGGDLCSHSLGTCAHNCGSNGSCNAKTGMCECGQGWTGPLCAEVSLLHVDTVWDAVVNKQAVSVDRATVPTVQSETFSRSHSGSCQSNVDCKKHGICVTGTCLCTRGWGGTDCGEDLSLMQEASHDEAIVSASLKELSHMQTTSQDQVAFLQASPAASKPESGPGHKHKELTLALVALGRRLSTVTPEVSPDDVIFQLQANVSRHRGHDDVSR